MKQPIYICGTGNLGTALLNGLLDAGMDVKGIYSLTKTESETGISVYKYEHLPPENALIFLCISDENISTVEMYFEKANIYSVHCSGSVAMSELKQTRHAVFYPLQTWSKSIKNEWKNVPVFLESNDDELLERLFQIAHKMGGNPQTADSKERAGLHLAAVFANNFGNAMFDIAIQLAEEAGFDAKVLLPLINKTVQKLDTLLPHQAQTGPAKRGDKTVMEKHLQMLKDKPEFAELYKLVSEYIARRK